MGVSLGHGAVRVEEEAGKACRTGEWREREVVAGRAAAAAED